MLHNVCSCWHFIANYASQTKDQYLVVLPQVSVNLQSVDFERFVVQLKDVVRDFSKAFSVCLTHFKEKRLFLGPQVLC